MNRNRAHWHYARIDHKKRMIFIEDDGGPKSITNAAEQVCEEAAGADCAGRDIQDYRLFYQDTEGDWDELVHRRGKFVAFKPCPDRKKLFGGMA